MNLGELDQVHNLLPFRNLLKMKGIATSNSFEDLRYVALGKIE